MALPVPDDVGDNIVPSVEPALNVHVPTPPVKSSFSQVDISSTIVGIVATIIIAALFYFKKAKYVYGFDIVTLGFIGLTVVGILGYFGWRLFTDLLIAANRNIDWISQILIVWNFVVVGLICLFWNGPKIVTQCYLVLNAKLSGPS